MWGTLHIGIHTVTKHIPTVSYNVDGLEEVILAGSYDSTVH